MTPIVAETVDSNRAGRPVNPESKRQQQLAAKAAGATGKLGRPKVEGSINSIREAARAEKLAAGGEIKRGRPAYSAEEKAAAKAAKKAKTKDTHIALAELERVEAEIYEETVA